VDKIIEYCLQDVKVTRDIFQYGRQQGHVKIARADQTAVSVPVQWN
jgi:DEAD/DEAH box helicase domain-containing protein